MKTTPHIHAPFWGLCLAITPLLMGCTETDFIQPAATSGTVWQAQYRASGTHGAMTGDEAMQITNSYARRIGSATTSNAAASDTAGAPDTGGTSQNTGR